jgi:arachidonate 15-lipoxygenase
MDLFNWFPRRNPVLPQHANPVQKTARGVQLKENQARYTYKKVQSLQGIPMVDEVPYTNLPTLPWLLKVLSAAITVASNSLADQLDGDRDVAEAKKELESARQSAASLEDSGQSWSEKLRFGIQNLVADPREKAMKALEDFLVAIEAETLRDNSRARSLIDYNTIFDTISLPEIANTFSTDDTFARLRVAGPNPMLISRLDQLPEKFLVTEAGFQKVMGTEDSLADALNEKRVFWLDYSAVQLLADNVGEYVGSNTTYQKQLAVPMALFAVPRGGSSLKPVAIQLEQTPSGGHSVVYAETSESAGADYWQWQAAKTAVQLADANYHEIFVHLARTHLVMEAFALATYRHLASIHPLYMLLVPHCEGTLFINNQATGSLISEGGPIDRVFAAKVKYSQEAAGIDRLAFDFYGMIPANDFATRKVDDTSILKDFPYRDDALLIWSTIHDWVSAYVKIYYKSDADVTGDTELAQWTQFLMEDGRVKGFRPITSREQLVDVLTMVIFTASAQHAAVNFPQRPLMSYAPAYSAAVWGGNLQETSSFEQWLEILPPIAVAKEQLTTLYLLGSVYYRQLGEYKTNTFPYSSWFQDPKIVAKGGPLEKFKAALETAEAEIKHRNDQRKEPYPFLLPSRIPPSINI